MASTGVPASSCRSPLTVTCKFNRHTVMSHIHLCPRCHFRFPNKNRTQSDSWSPVVCDKNEKREKITKTALSAVGSWSMARLKDSLLTVGGAALSVGPCWQFICALCTYIYTVYWCICVCVLQTEGQLLWDERWGRICRFQAGLQMDAGDGGGGRPGEVSTTVLSHHRVLVLNLSQGGGELSRWNYGAMSSGKTCTHWHVETESVCSPAVIQEDDEISNKTSEVIRQKTTEWMSVR